MTDFRKSSFSGGTNCVEVRISRDHDYVIVLDKRGNTVTYDHDEWRAFVAGVKNDEFDV